MNGLMVKISGEHVWSSHLAPVIHAVSIKRSQRALSLICDVLKPIFTKYHVGARYHTGPWG